jgi:hypothetical protein
MIVLLLFLLNCKKETSPQEAISEKNVQESPAEESKVKSEVKVPEGFKVLAEVKGDLDSDGVEELVVVYDTPKKTEMGTERQLHIFQKDNNNWKPWMQNSTVVLPSLHGGAMGDPFEEVQVENGSIVVKHFGGSREKWHYTHRYRFQNSDWSLIGATVVVSVPCEQSETFDYNISTGKVEVELAKETCSADGEPVGEPKKSKKEYKTPKTVVKMDGFTPGVNQKLLGKGKKQKEFYF